MKTAIKVAVGLSGGVDSAVSAALLVERGYEVTGVFLECWRGPGCRVDEDRKDALAVALDLKIPFEVLDFRREYKERVVDYFYREYVAGRTPNPDVMCNREIKFGMFYEWAMKNGFDHVATGHYARVEKRKATNEKRKTTTKNVKLEYQLLKGGDEKHDRRLNVSPGVSLAGAARAGFGGSWTCQDDYQLLGGVDAKKDQSYFLYQLRQEQLGHILFPVGGMTKTQVREEAKRLQLPVANKPDSQGICFIGPVRVVDFLKELGMNERVGEVVLKLKDTSEKGKTTQVDEIVVGRHKGVGFYTVGQRHGFKLDGVRFENDEQRQTFEAQFDLRNMPPLYVVEKDVDNNRLVVGTREQAMRGEFLVRDVHWIHRDLRGMNQDLRNLRVRIRHGGGLLHSKLEIRNSKLLVRLGEPVFGVAPGQACVFYEGDICLGGGTIVS